MEINRSTCPCSRTPGLSSLSRGNCARQCEAGSRCPESKNGGRKIKRHKHIHMHQVILDKLSAKSAKARRCQCGPGQTSLAAHLSKASSHAQCNGCNGMEKHPWNHKGSTEVEERKGTLGLLVSLRSKPSYVCIYIIYIIHTIYIHINCTMMFP